MYTQRYKVFLYMDIIQFIELIKNAKSLSPLLAINMIRVDDIVYSLSNAIHESSHNEFIITNINDIRSFSFALSGTVDKVSKLAVNKRISIRFNNNEYGLTIEYNDNAQFIKNEKLSDQYYNLANNVTASYSYQDNKMVLHDNYVTTNSGEKLSMDEYNDKYKIFESASKSKAA